MCIVLTISKKNNLKDFKATIEQKQEEIKPETFLENYKSNWKIISDAEKLIKATESIL